jgi:hypothetical protein
MGFRVGTDVTVVVSFSGLVGGGVGGVVGVGWCGLVGGVAGAAEPVKGFETRAGLLALNLGFA